MSKEINWVLKHKLSDLLDDLESETACVTYNGWFRRKDPKKIREEINLLLEEYLFASLD